MSLVDASTLWRAGMADVIYGDRRGLCLEQWPAAAAYVLHGKRPGARRVRRYLRRFHARESARRRAGLPWYDGYGNFWSWL